MQRRTTYQEHGRGEAEWRLDDTLIAPLAMLAFACKLLLRWLLLLLIRFFDFAFPILLQIARFPLFTLRIIGDVVFAVAAGILRLLPIAEKRRKAWRKRLRASWASLRRYLSYRVFEEAVHHAFENGMAWVFRRCRALTPSQAVLVLTCAVLWLPVSLTLATALHAFLIANAMSLPAWMQFLHPFATIIAKSKLLVIPVYPAAWPQAKRHPAIEAYFRAYRYLIGLYLCRKFATRYRQADEAAVACAVRTKRTRLAQGLFGIGRAIDKTLGGFIGAARRGAAWLWRAALRGLSALPLLGWVVRSYAAHYRRAGRRERKLSESTKDFVARWSVKFTAQYYEDRDRAKAGF